MNLSDVNIEAIFHHDALPDRRLKGWKLWFHRLVDWSLTLALLSGLVLVIWKLVRIWL